MVLENGAVPLDVLEELVDAWIATQRRTRLMADRHAPRPPLQQSAGARISTWRRCSRGVGIRFKGREREDVEEYCASEGWIRVQAGKAVDRHGMPVTVKLSGEVETWWRDEERREPAREAE